VTARASLALAALVVLVVGGPGARVDAEEGARPGPSAPTPPTRVAPVAPDIDLRRIRDIFRYGDEPHVGESAGGAPSRPSVVASAEAPSLAPRARLVGLVHRGGLPAAALSIDGEVVLLEEGESAGGFTVLGIGNEAVRLRSPGGEEEALPLP